MNKKTIFKKKCPICGTHYETTVRHQKYCTEVCRVTARYRETHEWDCKRAPQWYLDRVLGGNKSGAQDDIYIEAFRTVLHEEVKKIRDAGIKIDDSRIEFDNIRLHSAVRNWGLCYYPATYSRTKGGVLLPAYKYCFAFNRELMRHSQWAYRQTVMHELLHVAAHQNDSFRGRGHGRLWQSLAARINAKYGYQISRLSPRSKFEELDKAACAM